jgi:hypothetical protein
MSQPKHKVKVDWLELGLRIDQLMQHVLVTNVVGSFVCPQVVSSRLDNEE